MNKSTTARPHLLLLKYPPNSSAPPASEMQQIMARFSAWMAGLYQEGRVAATNGLEDTGKILQGPIGETVITDGPYAEGKEVVGGFVLLNESTFDQAMKIAQSCPGLDYRMIVEVRPVRPNS